MATMQPTWREERRRDRMAEAQIAREAETARTQARIAEAEARARLRRDEKATRHSDRRAARKQRSARRDTQVAWLRSHVVDLLFVPVIVVPGVLAWTAMAAYGSQVFGPAGAILPVFSEGAMWAFAGATTITRKRHPDRPLWHLRAGTAAFAAVGAAMNFIHGLTAQGAVGGIGDGVVMALVSVAGVVAHQLITAGPRRSRAERASARAERAAARRENAIRKAALHRTVAMLDEDGGVRLVHTPGAVALARRWGRAALKEVPPVLEVHSWPRPAPVLDVPATASASALPAPAQSASGGARKVHLEKPPASASGMHSVPASATASGGAVKTASHKRAPAQRTVTDATAERHYAADLAAGKLPSQRRIQSDLHVGQERAKAIREHLSRQIRGGQVVPLTRRA